MPRPASPTTRPRSSLPVHRGARRPQRRAPGRRAARARPRAARLRRVRPRDRRARGLVMIDARRHDRQPGHGRALHVHRHSGLHGRRAARVRLRAAPGGKGPDPARAPGPDRALRGRSPAAMRFRLGLRTFVAGRATSSRRRRASPTASRNAGDGEARMHVEVRPALAMEDMFAEVVALAEAGGMTKRGLPRNLADAGVARAPLRPGGARAAAQRHRPAAPARAAGLAVTAAVRAPCGGCARRPLRC